MVLTETTAKYKNTNIFLLRTGLWEIDEICQNFKKATKREQLIAQK